MEGVESGIEPAAPKKPALLKGGMIFCWIYGVVLALFLAMTSVLGDPAMSVGPSAEILGASRVFIIPLLALSIIVAYGLAKDRYWSRATMMVLLILGVVLIPPELASPAMYVSSVAVAGFGWWYLYRKANVVEYYHAIKQQTTALN